MQLQPQLQHQRMADEGGIPRGPTLRRDGTGIMWINDPDQKCELQELINDENIVNTLFPSSGKRTEITRADLAEMMEMIEGLHVLEAEQAEEDLLALTPKATIINVALDSGACDHVANKDDLRGLKIRETAASRAGRGYIAANGERIPNEGECEVALKDAKAGAEFSSLFQLAPVSRPLFSVSRICDRGCDVHFNNQRAKVTKNGRTLAVFERQNGLYVANMEIKGDGGGLASTFVGQGVRS